MNRQSKIISFFIMCFTMIIAFGFGYSNAEPGADGSDYTVTIPEGITFGGIDTDGGSTVVEITASGNIGEVKTLRVSLKDTGDFLAVPQETDDGNRSYEYMNLELSDKEKNECLAMQLEPPQQSQASEPIYSVVKVSNVEQGIGRPDDGYFDWFYLRSWSFGADNLYTFMSITGNNNSNEVSRSATIILEKPYIYNKKTVTDDATGQNSVEYEPDRNKKIKAEDYTGSLTFVISLDTDIINNTW